MGSLSASTGVRATARGGARQEQASLRERGAPAHVEVTRWMPHTDHDALAAATRTSLWPRWLGVATAQPAHLVEPGDSADGTLVVGRRSLAVRWTVTRRLRDIVTLEATVDGRTIATMVIGFGCWYDGCVAELRLTSAVGSELRLRRALRRSLVRLEEVVAPGGRPSGIPRRSV